MNYILFILFKTMSVLIFQGRDFESYSNYTILDILKNPVLSFFSIQDNDHQSRLILKILQSSNSTLSNFVNDLCNQ